DQRAPAQAGAEALDRGQARRLHRRHDADEVLDGRDVRGEPEDPGRHPQGLQVGRPRAPGDQHLEAAEPAARPQLRHVGQEPARLMLQTRGVTPYLYCLPATALIVLVFALPLVKLVELSLHLAQAGQTFGGVTLDNFRFAWDDPTFKQAVEHSAILLLAVP